ncbi:MAG: winged helix-turn-helix domain-containing protein [Candidatus Solibacter usitatus]|nr:winged helix-turn-helix domain-containing protein [Candidatus Solibacter usitatus]
MFDTLLYLIEHKDRAVSKDELIASVWQGGDVTDDAVFGCITDLRAALGEDKRDRVFIKTIPKTGYRFLSPVEVHANGVETQPAAKPPKPRWRFVVALEFGAVLMLLVFALYSVLIRRPPVLSHEETGWWRFEDGAGSRVVDASKTANHGVIVGKAEWIKARNGTALRFDGQGHVTGEDRGPAFPRDDAARTMSAWVQTATTGGEDTNIFRYGVDGFPLTRHFNLFLAQTGKVGFGYGTIDGAIRSKTPVVDGAWHFVAGVYEGPSTNRARLYIDGELEEAAKLPQLPKTGSNKQWLIGGPYASQTRFRGALDDVRLFSRPLRAAEIHALFRCSTSTLDFTAGNGRQLFYLPVFNASQDRVPLDLTPPGEIRHLSTDYAGIQLRETGGDCSAASLRGSDMGQDVKLRMEIRTPRSGEAISAAGPYFRSRSAVAGDGIIDGTSAGYWVVLDSDGVVKVRCLNPHQVVAYSAAPARFDADAFHKLELSVRGDTLAVSLDGAAVIFDHDNRRLETVAIPPLWNGAPPRGRNDGAMGIAFASHPRNKAGGQVVRNLTLDPLR